MSLLRRSLIAPSLALLLSTNIYAGETYTLESMPLKQAIKQITDDLKLPYIIDSKLLEGKKSIKINNIKGAKKALIKILDKANLEAQFKDDLIIIKKKVKKSINKQSSQTSLGEVTIVGNEESAFGKLDGYVATKSSTGSKMDLDITEIPQSVTVVTRDFMDIRNAQSIQSVLSYSSSVAQPYGEFGDVRFNWARSRGGSSLYADTFLDGLKMGYYIFAIPKTDMYALERVEVLKGPSSVLYGASSPGGLLNLQSKRANDSQSKDIELAIGSLKNRSFAFDLNNTLSEDAFLRLTGKYTVKGDKVGELDQDKSYFFNPALKYHVNDNTTLDFIASYSKDEMPGAGISSGTGMRLIYLDEIEKNKDGLAAFLGMNGIPLPSSAIQTAVDNAKKVNISKDIYIGHENDTLDRETVSFTTLLNHKINEQTQLNSIFRYLELEGKYLNSGFEASKMGEFLALQNYRNVPLAQKKYTFDFEAIGIDNNIQHKWDTTNVENTSMIGLDFHIQKANEKDYEGVNFSLDLSSPNYKKDIGKHTKLTNDYKNTLKQMGLYVQNQAKINQKIILSTAIRYDKVKEDTEDKVPNTSSTLKDNNVSGRIGLAYAFDSGITPYISYATSFSTNPGTSKAGKKFKPSIGKQVELGAKYKIEKFNTFLSSSIYQIKEKDILTDDPSNNGFSLQEADSNIKGFEFDVSLKPIENMNLVLSYTKLRTKQINNVNPDLDGLKLNRVPDTGFTLWTDYTIQNTSIGDFKLGAGLKHIGKSRKLVEESFNVTQGQPTKMKHIDSYTLVDLMLGTKYKNMDFTFNVANVFDKEAEIDPDSTSISITQGRTYSFRVKYSF